jgi:DNA repair protein RadC
MALNCNVVFPRADIQMTQAIIEVARPLGISVHDHIIEGAQADLT